MLLAENGSTCRGPNGLLDVHAQLLGREGIAPSTLAAYRRNILQSKRQSFMGKGGMPGDMVEFVAYCFGDRSNRKGTCHHTRFSHPVLYRDGIVWVLPTSYN